jgi:hypothetical protein
MGLPKSICINHIRRVILAVPHVLNVHELHCWTLSTGEAAATFHIIMEKTPGCEVDFTNFVLPLLSRELHRHCIYTITVQPEFVDPAVFAGFHEGFNPADDKHTIGNAQSAKLQPPKSRCFSVCDASCKSGACCSTQADSPLASPTAPSPRGSPLTTATTSQGSAMSPPSGVVFQALGPTE